MKRIYFTAFLLFLLLCFAKSAVADTFSCLACHGTMKGKIKTEKGLIDVNVDSEKYAQSVHGGINCITCHKQFSANPHQPENNSDIPADISTLAGIISHQVKTDPVAAAACTECHGEIYDAWKESIHGINIIEKKESDGAGCIECHGSPHYISPKISPESLVNQKNVVSGCGECHEKEELAEKYGFGKHILERYYESFHGKKYVLGHEKAPTCTNCHGYHNIKKWDDPKSPVAWENRTLTCGKCHEGATKKFVAAITHKPIGKDNPVPYYFEKGLILLLLGTFVFIVGHVVLETYSEIRNRFFKKDKEEHHE